MWSIACRSFKVRPGRAEQEAEALCHGHAEQEAVGLCRRRANLLAVTVRHRDTLGGAHAALDCSLLPISSSLPLLLVSVSALPGLMLPATASKRSTGSGRRRVGRASAALAVALLHGGMG